MRKCLWVLLALLLSGCGGQTRELPPPAQLFAAIQAEVELPEMIDTAGTELEALTGIGPELYESAVCFRLREGTAPDEIILVRGRERPRTSKSVWKSGWSTNRDPAGST